MEQQWVVPDHVHAFPTVYAESFKSFSFQSQLSQISAREFT